MAGNDVYLRSVPSDADSDDVRLYDPTIADSAGGTINATFAVTLDNVTQAATADLLIQATASQTIAAVTQTVTADVLIQATAAQTIAAFTQAATADALINATASQLIAAVTQAATSTLDAVAVTTQGGGWLDESQIRDYEHERKKRRKQIDELEETITTAYQRLTGKISAAPIIAAAQDNPEKLAVSAERLAIQLASKASNSARLRTRNAAIIADLHAQANAILEKENNDLQMEEEAIVILLAA